MVASIIFACYNWRVMSRDQFKRHTGRHPNVIWGFKTYRCGLSHKKASFSPYYKAAAEANSISYKNRPTEVILCVV
jgi:hypothetical protein